MDVPASPEEPFTVDGGDRDSPWLILCDHASNRVPDEIGGGSLGLTPADMARHIAYDPGARGVATGLAARLAAPCIAHRFSRLVIDPNRGEDDPTLVMRISDQTLVPANRGIAPAEIDRRIRAYHRPYHAAIDRLAGRRADTVIASIHSFTPRFRRRPLRPWQIGLLFGHDARMSEALARVMCNDAAFDAWMRRISGRELCLGLNEPYGGHLPGDTIDRHALTQGRPNLLLEIRQDLIETEAMQAAWAEWLARLLTAALDQAEPAGLAAAAGSG